MNYIEYQIVLKKSYRIILNHLNTNNFKVLIYIELQTKIAMITEDKVTEIFCMADDFCKFFDAMTAKYTLKPTGKRKYIIEILQCQR